jgi:hypothetical protein
MRTKKRVNDETLCVAVEQSLKDKIFRLSDERRVSASSLIREALAEGIKEDLRNFDEGVVNV